MNVPKGLKPDELKEYMIGRRFGRLVVTGCAGKDRSELRWSCICDCGNECTRRTSNLREKKDHSCRCWGEEKASVVGIKHGQHKTSEYTAYQAMKQRCYNPKSPMFKHYGERGITVCERWLESFENFLEDMGKKPNPKLSIDRIDVNGNYEPSNCRWADAVTQGNNTRRNTVFTLGETTGTLAEHCRRTGMFIGTVLHRLKRGKTYEEAFINKNGGQ